MKNIEHLRHVNPLCLVFSRHFNTFSSGSFISLQLKFLICISKYARLTKLLKHLWQVYCRTGWDRFPEQRRPWFIISFMPRIQKWQRLHFSASMLFPMHDKLCKANSSFPIIHLSHWKHLSTWIKDGCPASPLFWQSLSMSNMWVCEIFSSLITRLLLGAFDLTVSTFTASFSKGLGNFPPWHLTSPPTIVRCLYNSSPLNQLLHVGHW